MGWAWGGGGGWIYCGVLAGEDVLNDRNRYIGGTYGFSGGWIV